MQCNVIQRNAVQCNSVQLYVGKRWKRTDVVFAQTLIKSMFMLNWCINDLKRRVWCKVQNNNKENINRQFLQINKHVANTFSLR